MAEDWFTANAPKPTNWFEANAPAAPEPAKNWFAANAPSQEEQRLAQPTWMDTIRGEMKGLAKGVTAGWYDGSPTAAESKSMGTGETLGSVVVNAAPWLLGPEAGIPVNAAYAAAHEAAREKTNGKDFNPLAIGAQGVLGGAMGLVPMSAASIPVRAAIGAGIGALSAGGSQAVEQLNDTGKVDPQSLLPNMAIGAVTGGAINAKFGHALPPNEMGALGKAGRSIQESLAPQTISPASQMVANYQREMGGRVNMANGALERETKPVRDMFNKIPQQDRLDFMMNIDEGGPKPTDPALANAYDFFTSKLDQQKNEIQARGGLQSALQDYFPRAYQDPQKASAFMQSRSSLQGAQPNMRQRTIPTLREAIDPNQGGLTLASDNPADLFQQRMQAGERWKSAEDLRAYMDQNGLRKFAPTKFDIPDGWVPEPGTQPKFYVNAAHEQVKAGQSVVHPDLAPLLNNITGQSALANPTMGLLRDAGGLMNQTQLGLSAFHAGATGFNSYASKLPELLQHLKNGDFANAGKALVEAPFAPLVDMVRGHNLREDALNGISNDMTDKLTQAGGRVSYQDPFQTNYSKAFTDAIAQKNVGNALKAGVPALMETMSAPIMKGMVPRLKLGAFSNLARGVDTSKLSPEDARAVLGEIWNSVDNRFGQLTHDNMFMNRTVRDLSSLLMRSPGWNIGTAKELGGGLNDLAHGNLTNAASYAGTLPLTVGAMGAIYHYLHTGQMPQTPEDYFYPKTGDQAADGNDERMLPPTYLTKDMASIVDHPVQTLLNKTNPGIETINELFAKNKDFSGTQIRNPHDDLSDQAAQVAKYLGVQALPFTVRNIGQIGAGAQLGRQGTGIMPKVEQMFGLNAAPLRMGRSDAQNLAMEFLGDQTPQIRTPDEAAVSQAKRSLRMSIGKPGQDAGLQQAFDGGLIRPDDIARLAKQAGSPFFPGAIQRLPPEQVLNIFEKATPDERMQIAPLMAKQLRLLAKSPPFIRDSLMPRMMTALQSLTTP